MTQHIQHLERHPHSVDLTCWDCQTPLVKLLGYGQMYADSFSRHEMWYWFQCPYCGLYVQTDLSRKGLTSTLNQKEVHLGSAHDPANDPLQITDGYIATWPSTERCKTCRGWYPVQVTRLWLKGPGGLEALTEKIRIPGQAHTDTGDGQALPSCGCGNIDEQRPS